MVAFGDNWWQMVKIDHNCQNWSELSQMVILITIGTILSQLVTIVAVFQLSKLVIIVAIGQKCHRFKQVWTSLTVFRQILTI